MVEIKSGNAHRDHTQLAIDQWHKVNRHIETIEKNYRDPSVFKNYSSQQPQSIKHKVNSRKFLLLPLKSHGLQRIEASTSSSYLRPPVGI